MGNHYHTGFTAWLWWVRPCPYAVQTKRSASQLCVLSQSRFAVLQYIVFLCALRLPSRQHNMEMVTLCFRFFACIG